MINLVNKYCCPCVTEKITQTWVKIVPPGGPAEVAVPGVGEAHPEDAFADPSTRETGGLRVVTRRRDMANHPGGPGYLDTTSGTHSPQSTWETYPRDCVSQTSRLRFVSLAIGFIFASFVLIISGVICKFS